jgi:2-polyprenyl-3-methyl-5-hydroxy-6-metoxy-1,4-benzoquinol methylase
MTADVDDPTPQRTRGRVREERRFDKTQLHESGHGQQVHRDYAAHFFRWGWAGRLIPQGSAVLDVGCGQDQPLAKVLAGRPGGNREKYVGVDLNRINKKFNASWVTILDDTNFIAEWPKLRKAHGPFDWATCFEVIEHMGVADGAALLDGLYECLKPGGTLLLSTPVFSGQAAANHVHEYGVDELQTAIEAAGFTVEERWGTFGQLPKLKKVMDEHELAVMESMKQFYGNDVLSVVFALKHADQASNNAWVCRRPA